ncbi:MAG: DUF6017 domain-containing protein [Hungatella sp.]|uniref:DUF6017 domain-containing protein n=1 Tax=Hungatella sp. TaxID=2613924 RepID=UPI00399497D4
MVKQLKDIIQVQGINSLGYGIIPKMAMQDKRLTIQAKAIYSYFCSYAGAGKTAFPKQTKILADLKISRNCYYTHFNLLKEYGYIQTYQEKNDDGSFSRNIYTLVETLPCTKIEDTDTVSPCTISRDTVQRDTIKRDTNNNSIKINSIYNYQSVSQDERDGQPFKAVLDLIRENVSYEDLQAAYADDMELIDEFISIALDAIVSKSKTVRISGEDKPRELVKANLMKLTYADMEHVLWQFKEHGERIRKKSQYILSMLYHSPMELNAHYTNWVRSNETGKESDDGTDQ